MEDSNIELLRFSNGGYLISDWRVFLKPLLPDASYEAWMAEVLPLFKQNEKQVFDLSENRWIQCKICGHIDKSQQFSSYGGIFSLNNGICHKCSRKMK